MQNKVSWHGNERNRFILSKKTLKLISKKFYCTMGYKIINNCGHQKKELIREYILVKTKEINNFIRVSCI